jgi:hypothetical protein
VTFDVKKFAEYYTMDPEYKEMVDYMLDSIPVGEPFVSLDPETGNPFGLTADELLVIRNTVCLIRQSEYYGGN